MDDSKSDEKSKITVRDRTVKFAMVPIAVLADTEISASSKVLYGYLKSRCFQTDHCFPSQQTVAQDLGTDTRSIRRWLKELCDKKLVIVEKNTNSNVYILEDPKDVYGDLAVASWSQRQGNRTKLSSKSKRTYRTELSGATGQNCPVPSSIFNKKKKEEEEGTTTTTSIYSQNKTQPLDVKKVSVMDAKMLFASGHKEQKKKAVDKPKSTSRDHLGVSSEIRDCHRAYSEQMKTHGMAGGVLTKNKADVWGLFLQGQNTPSDGLKVIDYVMSHWKDLKRRYKLSEALPSIYFFKTGYIDPISIEVLSKATSNSRKLEQGYDSFKEMAEMARVSADRWSAKADRQDEAKQKNKRDQ